MEGITSLGGLIVGALTAAAAVLGGIATWRKVSNEAASSATAAFEETIARRDRQIESLEERIEEMRTRERALTEYVFHLQVYIQNGGKPPPPPWPAVLMRENPQSR